MDIKVDLHVNSHACAHSHTRSSYRQITVVSPILSRTDEAKNDIIEKRESGNLRMIDAMSVKVGALKLFLKRKKPSERFQEI